MIVRAKLIGIKNERRVVGWDELAKRRIREGDEFEIPDDIIEVDEIVDGKLTGRKIKKSRYFSEKWMEMVDQPKPKVGRPSKVSNENELI